MGGIISLRNLAQTYREKSNLRGDSQFAPGKRKRCAHLLLLILHSDDTLANRMMRAINAVKIFIFRFHGNSGCSFFHVLKFGARTCEEFSPRHLDFLISFAAKFVYLRHCTEKI